ncbi:MAG: CHASE2 domain-containing protein [Desulfobacterales bacterium]
MAKQITHNKYIVILSLSLAGFSVISISILLKGVIGEVLTQVDNTFYTQFLNVRERIGQDTEPVDSDIVIVGIDDRTLNKLGAYNPMEYRKYHIAALENIIKGKPAAVVFDILFGDPHQDLEVDRGLAGAMRSGPVFSVFFGAANDRSEGAFTSFSQKIPADDKTGYVSENGFERMSPPILEALTSVGLANAYPDHDGLIRKMPVFFKSNDRLYPTIALEIYRHIMGIKREDIQIKKRRVIIGETTIPVDESCRAYVDIDNSYRIREVPFYDVWKGRLPARYFKDKVVFIAATATALGDNKLVPLYGYIPGVLIHANLLLNLKNNAFIHEISGKLYYFLIFLTSFFYTYIYYSRSELSTVKKLMGYLSNVSLATKARKALMKLPAVDSAAQAFRIARDRHYGLRLFFLLFAEARKRIEPLLLHLVLLYVALFLLFYFFHLFIKPSAIFIQLLIAYITVSEFKRVDFAEIS